MSKRTYPVGSSPSIQTCGGSMIGNYIHGFEQLTKEEGRPPLRPLRSTRHGLVA
jgi:hypothetical protein